MISTGVAPPPPGRLEDLVMIQSPLSNGARPDHDKEDVVTQKLSTPNGIFPVNDEYWSFLRTKRPLVDWFELSRGSLMIPRHSFIPGLRCA